jgi:phosphoglycolate phosphatase
MFEGIRAVGFDLDNTFLRTHVDYGRIDRADRDACIRHGIPFDDIEFKTIKRQRAPIREWLSVHGRYDEFDALCKEIDEELTAIELEHIDEAAALPGSLECLDILRSKGLRVGLLTRGSYRYGDAALTMFGVRNKFDAIVGRDYGDYDDAKPSPKAMIYFARELGVRPSEVLYLGDNVTDYYSARDAGAHFIGVLSGSMDEEKWMAEDPDMTVIRFAGDVIHLIRPLFLQYGTSVHPIEHGWVHDMLGLADQSHGYFDGYRLKSGRRRL